MKAIDLNANSETPYELFTGENEYFGSTLLWFK